MGIKANLPNVLPAGCKNAFLHPFIPSNLLLPLIVLIIVLVLPLSSCIPYLAGVVVTSRMNANSRKDCVTQGGEYIDGSSWGWSGGKCMMPDDNIKVENLSPKERCEFFGGTYSYGACNFSPDQECANLGGIYYASTGACDLRQSEKNTNSDVKPVKKDNTITVQKCANLGGIYYASTGACDLRKLNEEK